MDKVMNNEVKKDGQNYRRESRKREVENPVGRNNRNALL